MKTIVFLLEEPSAQAMLEELIKMSFPTQEETIDIRYIVFEGKQDLEKNINRKIRSWLTPDSIFFVIRDQDSGNCIHIKKNLKTICASAGRTDAVVRIACHEIESFYLGDLVAVENALGLRHLAQHQDNKLYRNPDNLGNPKQLLKKITKGLYQQIDGSRRIAKHMHPDCNRSHSFKVLYKSLCEIFN